MIATLTHLENASTLYQKGGQHSLYMQPRSRGLGVFPRVQKCSFICWALTGPLSVVSMKCMMSLGMGVFFGALANGTLLRPFSWPFSLQDLCLVV